MVFGQHWYVSLPHSIYDGLTNRVSVHNDFHQTHGLFPLFDGLSVEGLEKPYEVQTNGVETNGVKTNGENGEIKA